MVFNVTVFPPVFGPVINKVEKLCPKLTLIGTTLFVSINGCFAFIKFNSLFSLIFGIIPFIFFAYFALAKM